MKAAPAPRIGEVSLVGEAQSRAGLTAAPVGRPVQIGVSDDGLWSVRAVRTASYPIGVAA